MRNKGPVYNLTTGKINFPIDDRVAIDPEGHISYRVGDHTTGPSKTVMTFLQGVGVLAVTGVMAALYYYGFGG